MADPSNKKTVPKEVRALDLGLTIDPGFVNHRRIETIIGESGVNVIDGKTARLPDMADYQRQVRIDQIYTRVLLEYCKIHEIPTLEQCLRDGVTKLFCSTLSVNPCVDIYDVSRAVSEWKSTLDLEFAVEFHYTTSRVRSDTLRSRLHGGSSISMVAILHSVSGSRLIFDPLVMGFPWVETDDPKWKDYVPWVGPSGYEVFIEDFDEFSEVSKNPLPADHLAMKMVPEVGLKRVLASHLGDPIQNDWGGETSDHFSTHLHLKGRRVTGAFLLKGPSHYRPMTIADLGKNGDQVLRLSQEPASVLIVQHCHDITPPVRSMLKAVAVQPSNPRRYCCVDGRETLRILHSLNLYELALASKDLLCLR